MSTPHRAGIYTVQVRPKYKKGEDEYCLLGDIDEKGRSLAEALGKIADGLTEQTEEGSTRIRCTSSTRTRDEVFMMLTHGQSGVVADIYDEEYRPAYHQDLEDTYEVKCGALFRFPPEQRRGWLAVHVNAGRGVKGLLVKGIDEGFRQEYPGLVLEINPAVSAQALKRAAQADRIEKMKLVKLIHPSDPALGIRNKWVRRNTIARLEIDLTGLSEPEGDTPKNRRARLREMLRPNLLLQFFQGDRDVARQEMVEMLGLTFDEVKFEIRLPSGATRTFNIERPGSGHAITEDLNDLKLTKGEPSEASLRAGLRAAIAHAQEEM